MKRTAPDALSPCPSRLHWGFTEGATPWLTPAVGATVIPSMRAVS